MRQLSLVLVASVLVICTACGDDDEAGRSDASVLVDGATSDAAASDAATSDAATSDAAVGDAAVVDAAVVDAAVVDAAAPDAPGADASPATSEEIAAARLTSGTGLALPISNATVTYLKPQIGNATNDPAGFTIQALQAGPALFVSVDPATLSPAPAVGDVVSFTITTMGTVGQQPRAQEIADYARSSTGADVTALTQTVSAVADLVSAEDDYDSELVTITGTLFEVFASSGAGFQKAGLSTVGIANDPNLQLRAPTTLITALDLAPACAVTVENVPVSRFNAQTQINVYSADDLSIVGCPAPTVVSASAQSTTSVRVTFSRSVLAGTVLADGSQFTFDQGLVASAATVSGNTVTVTTSAQGVGTTYTVTVATSITDLQGTPVGAPTTTAFAGFSAPAVVRINEVNASIGAGPATCDLIELRVVSGGSLAGHSLLERGTVLVTFPSVTVATNDFIIVHMAANNPTCNPDDATEELTSPMDQLGAMFSGNFDTAYDFWSVDSGLTNTDNVFTLLDANQVIVDALFVSDDPAGATAAAATETQAAIVGAANQWSPMLVTYIDDVFRTNAVDDLNATGTTSAGTSIQRTDDTDDNDKGDWTSGAGAASTWGALNSGQTAF